MTERMDERHARILNLVSDNEKISVAELSRIIGISEVTLRKDLSFLEERGLLRREHGYATMVNSDDVSKRLSFNYNIKRAIAARAANDIREGETVMIESGSCCALLAEALVSTHHDITIITNSVFIATHIRRSRNAKIILLGGEFQKEAQVMVGPLIGKCVEDFYVDKFFIGTDGFNNFGAMSGDLMRADAVRTMALNANRVVILTESKKFTQVGVVSLIPFEKIGAIYTDDQIAPSTLDLLSKKNIAVVTCGLDGSQRHCL